MKAKKSKRGDRLKSDEKYASKAPFFALRVPAKLLRAFKSTAKKRKVEPADMMRALMQRFAGVKS